MANKNRFIRNINAAANHRAVRTSGKIAVKGIEKTAKWMTTDHIGSSRLSSLMEFEQKMNYSNASLNLSTRRLARYGQNQSILESTLGWIADYLEYAWDMLLGFTIPIIKMFLWSIFSIIVIIVVNVIFFYGIYLLLIS